MFAWKFLASVLWLFPIIVSAQDEYDDKVGSPYFIATNDSGETVDLPLSKSLADVKIAGVIAEVSLTQVYENNTKTPVNAEYVFPGSSKSAVYSMVMRIGDREIIAEIKEKEEAQKVFDEAQADGKKASLLRQHRPNVFQMNVANIPPGGKIEVMLSYTELLVPVEGVYEFVLPTDVGERYTGEGGGQEWVSNPYVSGESQNLNYNKPYLDVNVLLNSGMTIRDLKCPSHQTDIDFNNRKSASIKLKSPGNDQMGPDFIVRYRLRGDKIETGLMCYEGEDENFFLYMAQPPKRFTTKEIPPREYIFIVDVSGSMNGRPLDVSKHLLKNLVGNLREEDRFNILLFASSSQVFAEESKAATQDNLDDAIAFITSQRGGGGTNMLEAIKRGMGLKQNPNYSTSFIMVTDGYVTVESEAFDYVKGHLGEANFFPFGIGTSVNRFIIEGLARVGNSEPFIVTNFGEGDEKADQFREYIKSPLLTDVDVDFDEFKAYAVVPEEQGDLFAERPIVVFGKYKEGANGEIVLNGLSGNAKFEGTAKLKDANISENNEALKYLWARHKIMELSDYESAARNEAHRDEIVELGLKYNLLSKYTSFVAVDDQPAEEVTNDTNHQTPSGGGVPEPHEWFFIIMISLVVLYVAYQRVLK